MTAMARTCDLVAAEIWRAPAAETREGVCAARELIRREFSVAEGEGRGRLSLDMHCGSVRVVAADTDRVSVAETDPRVGGKYKIVMSSDEKDWDHYGEYIEVERPSKLVFTWHTPSIDYNESLVTVLLEADGDKTRLRLIHERLPDHMVEPHRKGWTELLGNLDGLLTA